jgi:tetratricopeptide (TPR) repeat protein
MRKLLWLVLIMISVQNIYSQTNVELATEKKSKAIELMDSGSPDESIVLLEEAKKLDPDTYIYDYEIGYAYTLKEDYLRALEVYKKVIKYKDATDQCYQMLGNVYDYNGDPENAIKAYDKGLKKFPNSGRLYLEKGTVYLIQKKYNEALSFYEQGIKIDPAFPSNYYRAAKLLCDSDEEVWGMIYGEIFINLEPGTKRTEEISKLLYDTYKSQIEFTSDTSFTVSFSKYATINLGGKDDYEKIRLPYGVGVYEPVLMLSIIGEDKIDLSSLDRIREKFVSNYFEKKCNIEYPNILFDYHKTILETGYFSAYNYWLLSSGNPEAFKLWKAGNEDLWNSFAYWFDNYKLSPGPEKRFSRDQY